MTKTEEQLFYFRLGVQAGVLRAAELLVEHIDDGMADLDKASALLIAFEALATAHSTDYHEAQKH